MSIKLLLVDDSALIRVSLGRLLEDTPGVQSVEMAADLAQALTKVSDEAPDFMVLDLHLPDGNACDAIPRFRLLAPDMQIAVLTNDASPHNQRKCLEAGAAWFFDKSTEFGNVISVVRARSV